MAKANRRTIVVSDKFWEPLVALSKEEDRHLSCLIREALTDLYKKRNRVRGVYDPLTDSFKN